MTQRSVRYRIPQIIRAIKVGSVGITVLLHGFHGTVTKVRGQANSTNITYRTKHSTVPAACIPCACTYWSIVGASLSIPHLTNNLIKPRQA